jgi:hypothetical protein
MKKLASFGGSVLSKDQQKNVLGGKKYAVNCSTAPGYHQESPGSCSGTASGCQTAANNWCAQTAGCVSCGLS